MNQSRTKNTIRNMICGLFNKIVVLIFPFIIKTILIKKLGPEYLGLSSLFTSILQVLNLTELGFSSAIVFCMYKPLAEKDTKTICELMKFYKKIYRVIGIIILILGLFLLPILPKLINGTYPSDINIYILYILYLFNTLISYFLFAYKSALLTADQRVDLISSINTIISLIVYVFQICILCILKNYYIYVIAIGISNILNNIIVSRIVDRKYPEYICKGEISLALKKDIKKRVYGLMIQKICQTTRNSLDSIFISFFLGLNIVAIYNNYYTILSAVTSILSILTTSIVASIGNSVVTCSIEKNYNDMNKFNFIYMWLSGLCTSCLLCLFQPFMRFWMGENYMFSLNTVIYFCAYFYLLKMGDIRAVYAEATGIWYEARYRALVETILNVVLNYFLGKYYGVNGIIIATLISLFLINFVYGSTIIFKYYFKNISVIDYFKRHLYYLLVTMISCLVAFKTCSFVNIAGFMELIIKGIICMIVSNIVFYVFYFKYDMYSEMKIFIKNIIKKTNKDINLE